MPCCMHNTLCIFTSMRRSSEPWTQSLGLRLGLGFGLGPGHGLGFGFGLRLGLRLGLGLNMKREEMVI